MQMSSGVPRLKPFSRLGILDRAEQRRSSAKWIERLRVRSRDALQPMTGSPLDERAYKAIE